MQTSLNFSIIEQAQNRVRIARETNNGAAVRQIPTNASNYVDELQNGVNVAEKTPYYNDTISLGSFGTFDPLAAYESHQHWVFAYISSPDWAGKMATSQAAQLFDFNFWLETRSRADEEFANYRPIGCNSCQKNAIVDLIHLWKRYAATVKEARPYPEIDCAPVDPGENAEIVKINGQEWVKTARGFVPKNGIFMPASYAERLFMERLHSLYFYLWYTVLALQVDQISEMEHFTEMMECACCPIQMENVSLCVKLLAGHEAEDRDAFLAKLRPHFQNHLQRVKTKTITCDCGKGLE